MAAESLVSVRDLHRHYGDLHALRGIGFELRRGEVLGLLGPNGAGKTTTMQILCGVLAPSAGEVRIDGIDLLESPREAKRRLGYLPEHAPLYRELTVDEYLRFCARLRGVSARQTRAAVDEVKARCGLGDAGRRLIGNLSRGYQQRVGIAQAIVHRPAFVVLDEPTVGLDPIQIVEIRDLVRELGEDHGVVLSTHILPEVQAVCSRAHILHAGRLITDERLDVLDGGARTLRVRLRRVPGADALAGIDGVARVEALPDGVLRVHHSGDPEVAERIAERAATAGWGLQELAPERDSLEETFIALTCGDEPGAGADAPPPDAPA